MPVTELSYVLVADPQQAPPPDGQQQSQGAAVTEPPPPPPAQSLSPPPARYTRSLLRQTLQLMGQKPRQSDKAAQKVFLILQQRAALPPSEPLSLAARLAAGAGGHAGVTLQRAEFDRLVMDCLAAAAPTSEHPTAGAPAAVVAAAVAAGAALPPQHQAGHPQAEQEQQEQEAQQSEPRQQGAAPSHVQQQQEQQGLPAPAWPLLDLTAAQAPAQAAPTAAAPPAATIADAPHFGAAAAVAAAIAAAVPQAAPTAAAAASAAATLQAAPTAAAAAAAPLQARPPMLGDFHIACSLREQRTSVAVLLCGTSGTGKSTLAALLAARLGISTVVSTDSIRHMMRSFASEGEDPLLWASTYQAGAALQQLQAQAMGLGAGGGAAGSSAGAAAASAAAAAAAAQQLLQRYSCAPPYGLGGDGRKAAVRGYKAQSARVLEHVDRLLAGCEARRQSVVVEGVHLSLSMVVRLMQRHASVVPFLVHISNESKHMERFAVRSKVMTLRPDGNRYVKYFRNIRAIQEYLQKSADKHAIPKVDNTNVDRSVATIHTTVLGCLHRTARGESVLSGASLSCKLLLEEYLRCQTATWSSRDMLQLIRRKSAAGEAPSPSEDATSTATAPATMPTTGPLSEAAVEEPLRAGPSGRYPAVVGMGRQGKEEEAAAAQQQAAQQGGAAGRARGLGHEGGAGEEEGDNRSFYGSDSQESSSQDGSCSCCGSGSGSNSASGSEDEADTCSGEAPGAAAGGTGPSLSTSPRRAPVASGGGAGGSLSPRRGAASPEGAAAAAAAAAARRERHRERRRTWRSGSGGGSQVAEIPAGLVPERLRRRSEVGSVLEPEAHSDTEDGELGAAALLPVHA